MHGRLPRRWKPCGRASLRRSRRSGRRCRPSRRPRRQRRPPSAIADALYMSAQAPPAVAVQEAIGDAMLFCFAQPKKKRGGKGFEYVLLRVPGGAAARGGRRDHRQGRARGVRDVRPLVQRRVGPGVERLQPVAIPARVERRLCQRRDRQHGRRGHGVADRRFALRAGQRAEPGDAARNRRPRERHRHPAAGVDDRLRRRHHPLGLRSRRHPERGDGHRSRGPGHARPACWRGPRGLADGAGRQRAAGKAHRIRRCGLGRCLRASDASIRHEPHNRRDEERPPVPRRRRRDHRPDGAAHLAADAGCPACPATADCGARIRAEGWRQYIDSHPELQAQGFPDRHGSRRRLLAEESART